MGVRGLQSYLENYCQSAIPIECIQELAEKRRDYTDQELIIVVDGFNWIQHVYANLPWIGGTVLKEYVHNAEVFVQAFRDIGIQLVFFFDGPTVKKKHITWVERRMQTMEKACHIMDSIDAGYASDSISKQDYFIYPPAIYQQIQYILQTLNCEVYQTIHECDEEIVCFARKNDVLAVIGHDTDFVIFHIGRAFYLDMDHLDLQKMRTRIYYPELLAQSLGLKPHQLPLLATLMGNDFVKYNDLKSFHYKLSKEKFKNVKYLVPQIALYIKSLPVNYLEHKVLKDVAKYAFNDAFRAGDIEDSVVSYRTLDRPIEDCHSREKVEGGRWKNHKSYRNIGSGRSEQDRGENVTNWRAKPRENWREDSRREKEDKVWLELVKEVGQLFCNGKLPDTIYSVMNGLLFRSYPLIEDYRIVPRDLPVLAELTLELRQRLYGILLQQKPVRPGSHEVEEWCMVGPGSLDRARYSSAIAPGVSHPGLLALWGNVDRPCGRLGDIRWSLLVHSVSPDLDAKRVRMLPPHLVMPTLILYYIVHYKGPGRLEDWEADVVLATAVVLRHRDLRELSKISQDPMTSRSIRVSYLVMTTSRLLYCLLAACGYPLSLRETAPCKFFDGRLFQSKYRDAQQAGLSHAQLCDSRDDSLQAFQQARSVIFDKFRN